MSAETGVSSLKGLISGLLPHSGPKLVWPYNCLADHFLTKLLGNVLEGTWNAHNSSPPLDSQCAKLTG